MFKGFRFRREIDVFPWLKFNLSKTGISATIGPEDVHVTVGKGGPYLYMDMPGSGTYFRRKIGPLMEDVTGDDDKKSTSKTKSESDEEEPQKELIDFGFVDRLVKPPKEIAFVDTLKALHKDDMNAAYTHAKEAASIADGAFLAGFLAIQHDEWKLAIDYFERALEQRDHLGEAFAKYEVRMQVYLPISEEFMVAIQPTRRDCLLALAVAHERLHHDELAIRYLHEIREHYDPEDLIIRVMLAELYDELYGDNPRVQHEIVALAEGVKNDTPLHATLMYYRGKALRRLGVLEGARDTFTKALSKKKDYPSDLLVALRYQRALLYEQTGQEKQAHKEFEKIYALAPEHEDVAERLGLESVIHQAPPPGPLQEHPATEIDPNEPAPVDFELQKENAE